MAADTGWTTGDDTRTNEATSNDINGLAGLDTLDMSAVTVGIDLNLVSGAISSAETGIDTVRNVEIFRLGSGNDFLTGSDGNDIVLAGDGADELNGGLGRDILGGGAGDDILRGGTGVANELVGGAGNDVYYSDAAGDSVVESAGEGTDLVNTTRASFVLSANVENLIYAGGNSFVGIGNSGDNVITGGNAADTLAGRDGNDTLVGGGGAANTLIGGLGDDVYTVSAIGDSIVEAVGEGIDTVVTTLGSFRLGANVENLTASASLAFVGFGNALDNVITGGALGDTLTGLDGNDTLRGGTGSANTLIGGNGNDLYVVEAAGDTIVELSAGGTDTVETARAVFTLAAEVENLAFTGNGNNTGIGNAAANAMNGGAGNDLLAGLGGDDILTGGDGYDMFRFSETGNDTITDFVTRVDKILLSNTAFSHTATVDFVLGTAATGTNSAILYDQATGALAFDADGTGAGAAVSIANLGAATILAANDVIFY
jgi:Ca2+-binding RTX toxin-like protein